MAARTDRVSGPRHRLQVFLQWLLLGAGVGVLCGAASALFLALLDAATRFRTRNEVIVYTLPAAGFVVGLAYERWGRPLKGGNNLVIDGIHEDTPQIPVRMAPMVLVGTVLTHLFGGSAGREGTAVQMGGSLADALVHALGLGRQARRQLLAAGMAGGFGSVFGTPIAGAIFGLEVVVVGRLEYDALVPSLVAALVGDRVTRVLGITHAAYPVLASVAPTAVVLAKTVAVGAAMALVTIAFVDITHGLKRVLERRVPRRPLRMALGGAAVVLMWRACGTSDYLGLGVPMIVRSFHDPSLPLFAFAAKLAFTAVTLGSGFLGGEVTPLFFVGATLGNVVARAIGLPIELGAGVGMAAVFGAAANTPLALSIMAVELLGANALPHVIVVTATAYLLSGHRGIYPSQRLVRHKTGGPAAARLLPLHDVDERDAGTAAAPDEAPAASDPASRV